MCIKLQTRLEIAKVSRSQSTMLVVKGHVLTTNHHNNTQSEHSYPVREKHKATIKHLILNHKLTMNQTESFVQTDDTPLYVCFCFPV